LFRYLAVILVVGGSEDEDTPTPVRDPDPLEKSIKRASMFFFSAGENGPVRGRNRDDDEACIVDS
jgi:hypothetical protein